MNLPLIRNLLWIRKVIGFLTLAVCLTAVSAVAQMGGMGNGGGMSGQNSGDSGGGSGSGSGSSSLSRAGQDPLAGSGQQDMSVLSEQNFLRTLASNLQFENDLSHLALTNSSQNAVKKLAQQIIQDHQKLATPISDAARTRNFSLPGHVSGHAKKDEKKMQALTGSAFDQAYLKQLTHNINDDASSAKQALTSTNNPELRDLAKQVQTMTQQQLQQIDAITKTESLAQK